MLVGRVADRKRIKPHAACAVVHIVSRT